MKNAETLGRSFFHGSRYTFKNGRNSTVNLLCELVIPLRKKGESKNDETKKMHESDASFNISRVNECHIERL